MTQERADTVIFGAQAGDFLADRFSLASGDFNADGFADVLVGAPLADGPDDTREDAGEAYVILGRPTPPPVIDLAEGTADLTLFGGAAGDNFGFTVASGDVNGDGFDDVLVGARFALHGERRSVGSVYAVFGRRDLRGTVDTAAAGQDLTVIGQDAGDFWGIALAAGDADGDGVADLVLGASSADGPDNGRRDAGAVAVVRGSSDLGGAVDLALESPYFIVHGALAADMIPNRMATGDLNDDGRDELLLGAPSAEGGTPARGRPGAAYIIPVPDAGGILDLAAGNGSTVIRGASERDGLGFYVASGDVNGDGLDDAVIGARDADGPADERNNSGEVHVLLGSEGLPTAVDLADTALDATVYGADPNHSLGFTVTTGDLNGDGSDEIVAGAPVADSCDDARADGGDVYVVSHVSGELDLRRGGFAQLLYGEEAGDELGFSLATGDIDGNGRDDIIAGALLADGPDNAREDAGQAYIILSR